MTIEEKLSLSLVVLGLSWRTRKPLLSHSVEYVHELVRYNTRELHEIRGFGHRELQEVTKLLYKIAPEFAERFHRPSYFEKGRIIEQLIEELIQKAYALRDETWRGFVRRLREYLLTPMDEIELSVRSANRLKYSNIDYIYELAQKTEAEMLEIEGFGRKSLSEIKEILAGMGLRLGMSLQEIEFLVKVQNPLHPPT